MAFTTPPLIVDGVGNTTAAEMNTYIRDNLTFLRQRISVRMDTHDRAPATATAQDMLGPEATFGALTPEWESESTLWDGLVGTLDLSGTGKNGVWLIGGTVWYDENTTGDRRLEIDEVGGSTTLARWRTITNEAKRVRLSANTLTEASGTDKFDLTALQTSGGTLGMEGQIWAYWMGDTATSSDIVENTALTDSEGMVSWWNQWRKNVLRLHRRPSARVILNTNLTTLADSTWTKVPFDLETYDNAAMVSTDETRITAKYGGYYHVTSGVNVDAFNGTSDRVTVQYRVNGSGFGLNPIVYEVSGSADTAVVHSDIVRLETNDYIELWVFKSATGGNSTVVAGNSTYMAATLLSGDVTATNRQFFKTGLPAVIDYTAPDSVKMPRGLANISTRDLFCHLWNPPVISLQATTDGNSLTSGGWSDITLDVARYDNWGILDELSLRSNGGLKLPFDGMWLCVAGVKIFGADDDNSDGDRGFRIRHNSKSLSPMRSASATGSSLEWGQSSVALINGSKDDVITVQGLSSAVDEVTVRSCLMHLVWLGDKET